MAASSVPKGVPRKPSIAELSEAASSEFEEVRWEEPEPELPSRQLLPPSTSSLVSSIFGKTRSAPQAEPAATGASTASEPASQPEATPSAEEHASSAQDFDALKDFEAATQKLGEAARDAASQVSKQLFGGAADAKSGLARLAGDVTSWWATLDPTPPQPARAAAGTAEADECHKLFDLPASEELMERFSASLVQTYACSHNHLTPQREVTFKGALYITDRHMCVSCPSDDVAATVPLQEVMHASVDGKQLNISCRNGCSIKLADFQGGGLQSALGLIEHLSQQA